jgi:hypothetical protein
MKCNPTPFTSSPFDRSSSSSQETDVMEESLSQTETTSEVGKSALKTPPQAANKFNRRKISADNDFLSLYEQITLHAHNFLTGKYPLSTALNLAQEYHEKKLSKSRPKHEDQLTNHSLGYQALILGLCTTTGSHYERHTLSYQTWETIINIPDPVQQTNALVSFFRLSHNNLELSLNGVAHWLNQIEPFLNEIRANNLFNASVAFFQEAFILSTEAFFCAKHCKGNWTDIFRTILFHYPIVNTEGESHFLQGIVYKISRNAYYFLSAQGHENGMKRLLKFLQAVPSQALQHEFCHSLWLRFYDDGFDCPLLTGEWNIIRELTLHNYITKYSLKMTTEHLVYQCLERKPKRFIAHLKEEGCEFVGLHQALLDLLNASNNFLAKICKKFDNSPLLIKNSLYASLVNFLLENELYNMATSIASSLPHSTLRSNLFSAITIHCAQEKIEPFLFPCEIIPLRTVVLQGDEDETISMHDDFIELSASHYSDDSSS